MSMNIITGEIGAGKSTVCQRIAELARRAGLTCGGIISYKATDGEISIEDQRGGERRLLAGLQSQKPALQFGKFFFSYTGIEFGLEAIRSGVGEDILFVDELGPLELRKICFYSAVPLLASGSVRTSVVVIRKKLLPEYLRFFDLQPRVFEVTDSSRNDLPAIVVSSILSARSAIAPSAEPPPAENPQPAA